MIAAEDAETVERPRQVAAIDLFDSENCFQRLGYFSSVANQCSHLAPRDETGVRLPKGKG